MKDALGLLFKLSGKNPVTFASSFIAGVGILSWLDALAMDILHKPWALLDPIRIPIELVQYVARPLVAFILSPIPFTIPNSFLDYIWMGLIVAGMRLRSSWTIWRSLQNDKIMFYNQKTFLRFYPVVLRKGELGKFLWLFLPVRLGYAFILWPIKLIGAFTRYAWGPWKENIKDPGEVQAKRDQYLMFFGAIMFAIILMVFCLIVQAFRLLN